jgi:hypothetical protein
MKAALTVLILALIGAGVWMFQTGQFTFAPTRGTVPSITLPPGVDVPEDSGRRLALIIGNNDYPRDSEFPDLDNCIRDARLVKQTLEAVNFDTTLIENANRSVMDDALLTFENQIQAGDTALVYFAGHGIEFENKNYLMASNANFKARSRLGEESLEAETVAKAMLLGGAKRSFLFLDCCRESPEGGWLTRGQKRRGLAQIDVDGDIVIAYAAKPGQAALDGNGINSPYARALAKWIPQGLDHNDFFQEVRKEVDTITSGQQRTWENGGFLERFYFSVKAPGLEVANMPPVFDAPAPRVQETNRGSRAGEEREYAGMTFVWCPPGRFTMGSPASEQGRADDEAQVEVTLSEGFWLGKYEVTQEEWERVMNTNPSDFTGDPSRPVEKVSWHDAVAYCAALTTSERAAGRCPATWSPTGCRPKPSGSMPAGRGRRRASASGTTIRF